MSDQTRDALREREKALENKYFADEEKRLLEKMRAERAHLSEKDALAEVTGISDEALLTKLVELGIGVDTWAAMQIIPLVEMAWTDARAEGLDEREVRAVLAATEAEGAAKGSPVYELVKRWLATRPDPQLLVLWGEYMVALCANMTPTEREALRNEMVGRVRKVAEAAGGFLGFGNLSAGEKKLIRELEKAFDT
jgi:uncharacterized protein YhaN